MESAGPFKSTPTHSTRRRRSSRSTKMLKGNLSDEKGPRRAGETYVRRYVVGTYVLFSSFAPLRPSAPLRKSRAFFRKIEPSPLFKLAPEAVLGMFFRLRRQNTFQGRLFCLWARRLENQEAMLRSGEDIIEGPTHDHGQQQKKNFQANRAMTSPHDTPTTDVTHLQRN